MNLLALLLLLTATQEVPPPQLSQCLDINTASKAELLTWGGVTPEIADGIIKARPYKMVLEVQRAVPKEVWDKNNANLCLLVRGRGIQIISGNRTETLRFDAKPNEETKPAVQPLPPPTQPLPKEAVEERFRELSREAERVK